MKKIIICFTLIACLLSVTVFANEKVVPASALPEKATAFLNEYFSGIEIAYVEEDWGEFEVNLANGFEVTFLKNGNWEQVDAKYQAVPTGFIPQPILNTVQSNYAGVHIIKIEKDWAGFEVELSNRMELKIDANGKIYEIDYDD